MKKFLLTALTVFCFGLLTMCNNDIIPPAAARYTDGKMRLSLVSTARTLTEGHKMADIAHAAYLRVRFINGDSALVRGGSQVSVDGGTIVVTDVPSGYYSGVEVDIMDKLVTFTAVARGVTLSAAADNAIHAEIERTTPHLLVWGKNGPDDKYTYAFPDLADPSLCFCISQWVDRPFVGNIFIDKWGTMFYAKYDDNVIRSPSAGNYSSLPKIELRAVDPLSIVQGATVCFDAVKNTVYCYKVESTSSPSTLILYPSQDVWDGPTAFDPDHPKTAAITANWTVPLVVENGFAYVCDERPGGESSVIKKFSVEAGEVNDMLTIDEGVIKSCFIADGKLYAGVFQNNRKKLVVVDVSDKSHKTVELPGGQNIDLMALLGVRGKRAYFAVEISGTGTPTMYCVGYYEEGKFQILDSAPLLAAMKRSTQGRPNVEINWD